MKEYTKIIKERPLRSGTLNTPDGAICGNGDIAAILGDSDSGMRIHIAKCDMWRACEIHGKGGLRPIGYVDIDIPKALYDNYYVEQRMSRAELFCSFKSDEDFLSVKLFVSAVSNNIYLEIKHSSIADDYGVRLIPRRFEATVSDFEASPDIRGFVKSFVGDELAFETHCAAGIRQIKHSRGYALYQLCIYTNHDTDSYLSSVKDKLASGCEEHYLAEYGRHLAWWEDFYGKSDVRMDDSEIELNWHASQYFLAICARNTKFAPGIYGNFITNDTPGWKGDYHLNYNYQAPFYHLCSSNHVELTDSYPTPLLEFTERGKRLSRDYLGTDGVYFPIAMGPKGTCTEYPEGKFFYERLDLGQRSTAAHAADILIFRWYATRDGEYARAYIYPFLRECGLFWESYLKKEGNRYVILRDAIHEVPCFKPNWEEIKENYLHLFENKNPLFSLGIVRMLFGALIDISKALGLDEEKRPVWQDILDNISDYPTFIKDGQEVFRYTECGVEWVDGNSLCLQHCFPASQIGLGSDTKLLEIARRTFFATDRWLDDNATNSIFPIAARLGISPKLILEKLRENYKAFQLPNLLFLHRGGCLENCSLSASTVNEMLLQGYEGILRIFPVWDRDIDCEFENLRADGAFLVSSKMKSGQIEFVKIESERGMPLTVENPYGRATVTVGNQSFTVDSQTIKLNTNKNDTVYITPAIGE